MITGFDLPVLQAELAAARFDLVEDLDPEEQQRRYFNGRTDGYHATEHFHFACATPVERLTAGWSGPARRRPLSLGVIRTAASPAEW